MPHCYYQFLLLPSICLAKNHTLVRKRIRDGKNGREGHYTPCYWVITPAFCFIQPQQLSLEKENAITLGPLLVLCFSHMPDLQLAAPHCGCKGRHIEKKKEHQKTTWVDWQNICRCDTIWSFREKQIRDRGCLIVYTSTFCPPGSY